MSAPHFYFIPDSLPFIETLAKGLLHKFPDPLALAQTALFLPNQRSCRHLEETLLRVSDKESILLPRIFPIGQIEAWLPQLAPEICLESNPKPLQGFSQTLALAEHIRTENPDMRLSHIFTLAKTLNQLFNECTRENIPFQHFQKLIPLELAQHEEQTLSFLCKIAESWPNHLKQTGQQTLEYYRSHQLQRAAAYWKKSPPKFSLVAAGSVGSVPTTRMLLQTIAALPDGEVILPGYGDATSLPYFHHHRTAPIAAPWPCLKADASTVINPWSSQKIPADHIYYSEAEHPAEEASIIAGHVHHMFATKPGLTAIVTSDRRLAHLLKLHFEILGIPARSTMNDTLAEHQVGSFLHAILDAIDHQFIPTSIITLLHHPFCKPVEDSGTWAANMDIRILRGVRHYDNAENLHHYVAQKEPALLQGLETFLAAVKDLQEAFAANRKHTLQEWLHIHMRAAQNLAKYAPEYRLAEKDLLIPNLPTILLELRGSEYLEIFNQWLEHTSIYQKTQRAPLVTILPSQEARLTQYDYVIIPRFNEAEWPQRASHPWIRPAMRELLELPPIHAHESLQAHDFLQLLHSPHLLITSVKTSGNKVTPHSTWLHRLESVLETRVTKIDLKPLALSLFSPSAPQPASPFTYPNPPAEIRPRELSASSLQSLLNNPYKYYAEQILKLRPLEPVDAPLNNAHLGSAAHNMLEEYTQARNMSLSSADAKDKALNSVLSREQMTSSLFSYWWQLKLQFALDNFILDDEQRRADCQEIQAEQTYRRNIEIDQATYTLSGRIDRIEWQSSQTFIFDYKTGEPPTDKDIEKGKAVQPMVLGWVYEPYTKNPITLGYWKISLHGSGSKIVPYPDLYQKQAPLFFDQTVRLLRHYASQPYEYPWSFHAAYESEKAYAHLFRIDALRAA